MKSIYLEERNKLELKGAQKVISSTASQAVVEMSDETVVISGTNLEVVKLDLENKIVNFAGIVNNIKFSSKQEKTSLVKKIFK